jgi:hypothetical protein
MQADIQTTELCDIAYKYGTDKCPQLVHSYTPFYYKMFSSRRESIRKILELGIGYDETMDHVSIIYDKHLKRYYQKGASLLMWRDFFSNALVYGADIQPASMLEAERIRTFVVDERKAEDLEMLIGQTGPDIDLLVDDASHLKRNQVFACRTLMPLLWKSVTYIIEDVRTPEYILERLDGDYDCERINFTAPSRRNDCLIVVRHRT